MMSKQHHKSNEENESWGYWSTGMSIKMAEQILFLNIHGKYSLPFYMHSGSDVYDKQTLYSVHCQQ